MSKAAHTQTPWQRSWSDTDKLHYIEDIYGNSVAVACRRANELDSAGLIDNVTRNNAELIVTAVNHHQELVTRLYNLVNAVETADKDDRTAGSVSLRIEEARETLKKVIQ